MRLRDGATFHDDRLQNQSPINVLAAPPVALQVWPRPHLCQVCYMKAQHHLKVDVLVDWAYMIYHGACKH
jgi:hypothetical protein